LRLKRGRTSNMPAAFRTLLNPDGAATLPVTGAALWLDASDKTTLYTDAGTTNVVNNDDLVYQWNDLSGNGRHVTQATSGNRPKYKTPANGQNGLSILALSSSWMKASFTSTNIATVFIVTAETGFTIAMELAGLLPYSSSNYICGRLPSSTAWNGGDVNDFLTNGSSGSIYINNVNTTTNSYQSWKVFNMVRTSALSKSDFVIGYGGNPSYLRYWAGKIGEVILYPTALSSTDRTTVYDYLKAKWNTP